MIKKLVSLWHENKHILESELRKSIKQSRIYDLDYIDLVMLTFRCIANSGAERRECEWGGLNTKGIREIDNGDYQGTYLYTVPADMYQPTETDYLLTFVGYGSCSACDTLQSAKDLVLFGQDNEKVLSAYMRLCKDHITNTTKPYSGGWNLEEFDEQAAWEKTVEETE